MIKYSFHKALSRFNILYILISERSKDLTLPDEAMTVLDHCSMDCRIWFASSISPRSLHN